MQLTHIIAEKEKKSSSYKDNKLDVLSDEKTSKIKKFAREYIHKVLHKLEKGKRRPPDSDSGMSAQSRGHHPHSSKSTTPRPLLSTPSLQGEDGGDVDMDMEEMEMSVEEAMDLSADEDDADAVDVDADEDDEPTPVEPAESDTSTAVASAPASAAAPADPRLRARATTAAAATASFAAVSVKAKEKGWEMLGLSFESSTTAAS